MDWNKGSTFLVLGAFFVLLFASGTFAAASTPSEYYYLASISSPRFLPATINAGDIVSIALDIENQGIITPMLDTNAVIDVGGYFQPVLVEDYIGKINADSIKTTVLKLKVNPDTQPGYYQVQFRLSYTRDGTPITQTQTITIPVSSSQRNISVQISPKVINPGNQSVVDFSISNLGSVAVSNVLLSWSESTGLILPLGSDNRKFASVINPGEVLDFNYVIAADPGITTGIYPLSVEVSFTDSGGAQTQSSTVGIIVGGSTDFDVSSDYSSSSLSFSIANVGSNDAAAVVVKLAKQTGLTILGSDTVVIGALNKGDYSIANFTVSSSVGDANSQAVAGRRNNSAASPFGASAASNVFGGQAGGDVNSAGGAGSAQGAPVGASGAPQIALPSSFVVDIYYTDTTGERQHVQKNFALNSKTSGFAAGAVGVASVGGGGTDYVLIAVVLAIIVAVGAVFNKFKAKKNWKSFLSVVIVGVLVPAAILLAGPKAYVTAILAAAFMAGLVALFFVRGK